jgi:site-specific recombinase XerD
MVQTGAGVAKGIAKALKGKGRWDVKSPGMTFEETLERFLNSRQLGIEGANKAVKERTITEYTGDLKVFFDFVKSKGLTHYNELAGDHINAFLAFMQSPDRGNGGWSKATQRKYLISLKAYFRWVSLAPACKDLKMATFFTNLPRIGKEVRREFIPSQEQMDTFRNGFDKKVVWGLRDWTALTLMLDTGARIGEVCNLEPEDIHWDVSMVNLDGKTGKRLVPFDKEITGRALRDWMNIRRRYAHAECKKVFVSRYGGKTIPNTFAQSFSDNLRSTGLDKTLGDNTISCHTVRHYFCTHYLINGGTLHNLQKITGHKTMDTLMIYVNLANQMKTVAEEHSRVSPLKKMNASATLGADKKRKLIRL